MADRQAGVLVGLGRQRGIDELVARHRGHRGQHGLMASPAGRAAAPSRAHVGRIQAQADGSCSARARRRGPAATARCGRSTAARLTAVSGSRSTAATRRRTDLPQRRTGTSAPRRASALIGPAIRARRGSAGVFGQVDLQRRDRDLAVRCGVKVGALARLARIAGRADPVHRFRRAGWSGGSRGSLAWRRPSRVTTRSAGVGIGTVRNVHVEQPGRRSPAASRSTCSMTARATRAAASRSPQPFVDLRKRDRRNAEQVAFHRRRRRCPSRACRRPCWRRC